MLHPLHNFHLIFHLLVEYAVLDESAFLQLFSRIRPPIIFRGHLVNHSESTFSDRPNSVIFS